VIAVDTNIPLRLILADDAAQLGLILEIMEHEELFVSLTVLLETGWVLQSRMGMSRNQVADRLASLMELERIEVARPTLADWAIERYRAGADLADMIHLAASAKLDSFMTFDGGVAKRAGSNPPLEIRTLKT
jgi:predicted nucleic-acid-binding protein